MKIADERNKSNVFDSTILNKNDKFCRYCHLQLVQRINDPLIYACPSCNTTANIVDTYPKTSVRTTFPHHDPTLTSNQHAKVLQSEDQKLPRSEYYFKRRMKERTSEAEANDLMLQKLRGSSQITIKDVYYSSYDDE